MKDYGMNSNNAIHPVSVHYDVETAEIFQKSLPSDPLACIAIHIFDDGLDPREVASQTIKDCYCYDGNQNAYIIDLSGEVIGNYFFTGLIADSFDDYKSFFKDLKEGSIEIGIINIDNTRCKVTTGRIVQDLITLVGDCTSTVVRIFIKEKNAQTLLKSINDSMDSFFIKYKGEIYSDDN